MLKYDNYEITFAETPDEISLYITISNCPIHCPNCNSKHLWSNVGVVLDWSSLSTLIHANKGISTISFGGGDSSPKEINELAYQVKCNTDLKVCWYSGRDDISKEIDLNNFDFIKIGRFIDLPLNKVGTNQKFYKVEHSDNNKLIDLTFKFQKQ